MDTTLSSESQGHVSLAEAASKLGVSKATLRNWDKAGKLTAIRHPINGYRLYDLEELKKIQAQLGLFPEEEQEQKLEELDLRAVRRLVSRLHNILRDTDSQSNIIERFDELTKMLFAKVISDKLSAKNKSPLSISSSAPNPKAIRQYYKDLAQQYKEIIPSRFSTLKCSDQAIIDCVSTLRPFDFSSTKFDIKGIAYEEVIRNTFDKGDHQQFFTPPHIVDFVVSMCAPFIQGEVCDPASGTGGFLASIARKKLKYRSLTGIEIDERLSWVTGINLTLHDAKNIKTIFWPKGGTLGAEAESKFASFDVIITNPPFGSDFTDQSSLEKMTLGEGRSSRRRGILFLERCHSLLKDNGTLAIIIDEGVLNLSHAVDVRHFLTKSFDLKAVISLPETAFMPYANVNTSILILKKRVSTDSNGFVFFAKAEFVGRKPNGDEDVEYDKSGKSYLNSDLPEILRLWNDSYNGSPIPTTEKVYVADVAANLAGDGNGHRIDFQYHHPSRRLSSKLIAKCKYELFRLGDICSERNATVIPSKELTESLIRYTGLAHIEAYTGKAEQTPTPADSLKSAVKVYKPGDIVFAKMRPNLRKVALMDFSESGYISPECAVLTVNRDKKEEPFIDPLLLAVLLRSDFVYGQIMHLIAGIGRPRINSRELHQVMIPVPPKTEQNRIRDTYLGKQATAEQLKAKAQQLLFESEALLENSVKGVAASFARSHQ